MNEIRSILNKNLRKMGLLGKLNENLALVLWKKKVGNVISSLTHPCHVENGILTVAVKNSSWSHHLYMMKMKFISELNSELGKDVIKDIRFIVKDPWIWDKGGDMPSGDENLLSAEEIEKIDIEPEISEEMERVTESISDDELRKSFFSLWSKHVKKSRFLSGKGMKKCKVCGAVCMDAEAEICPVCLGSSKRMCEDAQLIWFIKENPWLGYDQVVRYFPGLLEEDFISAKRLVELQILEEIDRLIPEGLSKEGEERKKIKLLIQTYVILKKGVHPLELTEDMIKEVAGERFQW